MARSLPPLELWAGVECTHNRVGDRRRDQLARTGHWDRLEDLDLLASTGVRAVRYPVLWEHVHGDDGAREDWSWPDERLARLRELGIRPVVTLLHHGTGPGDEAFDDPAFAERFAAFAASVAERYPWVCDYIPINEPLTTARFSGLYGVWYPHARDRRVFARILIAQMRATVLAARAIRRIVPEARLIQNEDVGTIRAVPSLQYQADFENERRWVTFDLLCGRLRPGMRMWDELVAGGIDERELHWFAANATPPDALACDNYITSDRLLDDTLDPYPEWSHGGNGLHRYTDIESVRATADEPAGFLPILREAWERYRRPLMIGEAHISCTREEQMRWLRDVWKIAHLVRSEGVDLRSVTVWAAFGAYDWNTLVTQDNGFYEPGAFDVRAGEPRRTALVPMMRALTEEGDYDHPALDAEGWWRRPERLMYPPVELSPLRYAEPRLRNVLPKRPRPLAVAGHGPLLDVVHRIAGVRALATVTVSHDAGNRVEPVLAAASTWAVVDAVGCLERSGTARGHARSDIARSHALAHACSDLDVPLLLLSCHHADAATNEGAGGTCGVASRAREVAAREILDRVLVVRLGELLDPWDDADPTVRALAGGTDAVASNATAVAYAPDAVNVALDLLIDEEAGIWHVEHADAASPKAIIEAARAIAGGREPQLEARARMVREERLYPLPHLRDALTRFVRESEPLWRRAGAPQPSPVVELDAGPGFEFPATEPGPPPERPMDVKAG